MTLLSRKADYTLLILAYLHQNVVGGNAREIAEEYGLSRPFVANILKELCHNCYVSSTRGVKGGYVLLPSCRGVNLGELLEAIGEGFRLTVCSSVNSPEEMCSLEATCPVKNPLAAIHRRIAEVLHSMTLQDLFDAGGKPSDETFTLFPSLPVRAAVTNRHQIV